MAEQQAPLPYNNPRFKVKQYDFEIFLGPAAGEKIQNFTLTDLNTGDEVKLSDFAGKWLVIETASSTCSMYTKNIEIMEGVAKSFPDVEFICVYVREAHPGERLGPHKSMEEKKAAANLLAPRYGEFRRILVDNLDGDFHKAYGSMPNVCYVVRPDGTVHYRCNWTAPHLLEETLKDRENLHTVENAPMLELRASRKKLNMIRTMWTGGFIAWWDFLKGAPHVIAKHHAVDSYYNKHGRFQNTPRKEGDAPASSA